MSNWFDELRRAGYRHAMKRPSGYRYLGPAEFHDRLPSVEAVIVDSSAVLECWLAGRARAELNEPFTFIVALDGRLRLAPRRSEHVALAAGHDVLAAGEMTFTHEVAARSVLEVTNQSTGYCPDASCWTPVHRALNRLGLEHPGDFTTKVVFRLCSSCGERNIVRDGDFTCALCDSALPLHWNFVPG